MGNGIDAGGTGVLRFSSLGGETQETLIHKVSANARASHINVISYRCRSHSHLELPDHDAY